MPAKTKSVKSTTGSKKAGKMAVQNVNVPGYTHMVDAEKYKAMRALMLKLLPSKAPGLTQAEMWKTLHAHAPKTLFPDSGKVGWWMKTAQLDLEAKGLVKREASKPLRWHKAK